jgi:hypothetical protein
VSDTQLDGDDMIMNYGGRSGKAQLAIQQLPSLWNELNIHRRKDGISAWLRQIKWGIVKAG